MARLDALRVNGTAPAVVALPPDLAEAARFLHILDETADAFAFRALAEGESRAPALQWLAPFDEAAPLLARANAEGRGAFVGINETSGSKARDVRRVRAVFVDLDGAELGPVLDGPLEPHAIVETSPGRWHVYWLTDGLALDQFAGVQRAIAARFGGDPSVCDVGRIMRLPGFDHRKGAPFRVRLIHESGALPYAASAILGAFPPEVEQGQGAKPAPRLLADARGPVVETDRHADLLRLTARLARAGLPRDSVLAAVQKEAARGRWTRALDPGEIERAINGACAKLGSGEWSSDPGEAHRPEPHTAARRGFGFAQAAELDLAPPDWLIRGLIERDTLLSLSGPPGGGKSFLALSWAYCIAAGLDWFGHRVAQGPVLYLCGEGLRGVTRRLRALEIDTGAPLASLPLYVSRGPAGLLDPLELAAVLREVERVTEAHGRPALLVVDTVARNFGPGDENSTEDMRQFVAACDRLREVAGAVALVHHVGHGDKTRGRGSSVLPGAVDADLILCVDEGRVIRLESNKVKDGEPLAPLAFRLERVDLGAFDDEGEPITSAVLRHMPDAAQIVRGKRAQGKNQVLALDLLRAEYARRRANVEASGRPASAALVDLERWRALCAEQGIDRRRFSEVRAGLEAAGAVVVELPHVRLSETAPEAPP